MNARVVSHGAKEHRTEFMTTSTYLGRDAFRETVLRRDNYTCVLCKQTAVDAHHILDRKLWSDGGYYEDNGASVCAPCHLKCETTQISPEEVRKAAGIENVVIPPQLDSDQRYDKWGNPIMRNGQRLKGELFTDAGAQNALRAGGVIANFTNWVKYPRTPHLPWSPTPAADDRMMQDTFSFDWDVVVTEKMDGECTTLYRDHYHARSVESNSRADQSWVRNFWGSLKSDIPEGWRICGENLYAKHSIHYTQLSSYFLGFSIWDNNNICKSWDDTVEWFELLGIHHVPILYRGAFDVDKIKALWHPDTNKEGYVVRTVTEFPFHRFDRCVGKFVRPHHVKTTEHWRHEPIVQNKTVDNRS